MTLAIAITTAPRPRETFSHSIKSMRYAGFTQMVLVSADGVEPQTHGVTTVVRNYPPLGGLKNWCATLEMLVDNTSADWLMVCEDDIIWAPRSYRALMTDLALLAKSKVSDRVGYLSLYLSRKVSREIEKRKGNRRLNAGLHVSLSAHECWGSQAYVIPRKTAIALLAEPTFDDFRRNYEKNRNRDNIVSGRLTAMGMLLYYRVPCLVTHTMGSANSSLGDKPVQRALLTDYWRGKP